MVNQALYTKLIEYISLEDIFVKDLAMNRNPVSLKDGEELHADVKILPRLELVTNDHLIASVNFHVNAQTKDELELFSMDFEYATIYSIGGEESFPQEELQQIAEVFVDRNVPINVWPFARELVADLSNRMNVPRLLIGMYRYIPTKETDDSQNDRD